MAKTIKTSYPSFPEVRFDKVLNIKKRKRWQVLCGDKKHYRIGVYSPEYTKASDIKIMEKHNCPEFFMLIKGNLSLLICDDSGREKIIKLKPEKPVFVTDWHNGFCADGKFKGLAIVVERDEFNTMYKTREELNQRR